MRYFNDSWSAVPHLAYGELLISGVIRWDVPLIRATTTTAMEPGVIGKLIHDVSHRERTMEPLFEFGRHGRRGEQIAHHKHVHSQRLVEGIKVTDREEIFARIDSDGYVTQFDVGWPGKDGYGNYFAFRDLSSRLPYGIDTNLETNQPKDYMAEAFPPELRADSSLWQKLYIPAPWRDMEMLGQALLNALKYSDHPYRKWMTSFFDRPKPKGRVKLHRAAMDGDAEAFPKSNRSGKSYDIVDSYGKTPLMFAAENGHGDIIERLLSLGADVNMGDYAGQSPLHHAATSGRTDTLVQLISAGAHVDQPDFIGRTALHIAAKFGHATCAEELLRAGANPDAHDEEYSSTPLHLAARGNHVEVAGVLIRHGAEIDARNEGGRTPLHVASAYGHPEIMAPLLGAGAAVNYLDGIEESPLSSAVFFQHLEAMRVLIGHGANVNLAGYRGYTPLHVAGYTNREVAAALLIEEGANLEVGDNGGLTPLDLALVNIRPYDLSQGFNSEVLDTFLQCGASVNPMRIPVQDRHALWPQLTPPNMVDASGYLITRTVPTIPPDLAAELDAVRPHSIREEPEIVWNPSDNLQCDAVRKGLNVLVARMLEAGMAESPRTKLNMLREAVRSSNADAIRILAENGADLDYPSSMLLQDEGYQRYSLPSPVLDLAVSEGNVDMVRLLLELGATPSANMRGLARFKELIEQYEESQPNS